MIAFRDYIVTTLQRHPKHNSLNLRVCTLTLALTLALTSTLIFKSIFLSIARTLAPYPPCTFSILALLLI